MSRVSPNEPPPGDIDDALDALILAIVWKSRARLTPADLKKKVQKKHSLETGQFKAAVGRLIRQKELIYTYQFGNSFLEPSFDKPVRVSPSIVLKPPVCTYHPAPGDIVINLKAGAAFGSGVHPTTRLCLQGLETRCYGRAGHSRGQSGDVLDIGTGSGVLLIAALKMGMVRGVGLDIDPCALVEARENLSLNNLMGRADISDRSLDGIAGQFLIVLANLRLPTLQTYFATMCGRMEQDGALIVSGIKSNEFRTLKKIAENHGMQVCWRGVDHGWCALVMEKDDATAGFKKKGAA